MQKNIIMLVIDAMGYENIFEGAMANKTAPFLASLQDKSIFASKLYSEGPYTEAALMSLVCGQRIQDNNGYLKRYADCPKNLYEVLHEQGYCVFMNNGQPHMFNDSMERGIDYLYYNVPPDFNAIRQYRLGYYRDLQQDNLITDYDITTLVECIEGYLHCYKKTVESLINKDKLTMMIVDNIKGYDYKAILSLIDAELALLSVDKEAYIMDILKDESNSLYTIPQITLNNKIHKEESKEYYLKTFAPVYDLLSKKAVRLNIKNNKINFKLINNAILSFIKKPSKQTLKGLLKSVYRNIDAKLYFDKKDSFISDYGSFKNAPSINTHINYFFDWKANYDNKSPYFAYIHVDDVHYPSVFCTYDSENKELLADEANYAMEYINDLDKNYKGSLVYDLSIHHIDRVVRNFYEKLKQEVDFENTMIVITSDHGYSYNRFPIRDTLVNSWFLENFHSPLFILNSGLAPMKIDEYRNSFDIPSTILALLGIEQPSNFVGKPLYEKADLPYIMLEYMGGGCPDMRRKAIKYACFDSEYFVAVEAKLSEKITIDNVKEIYDLFADNFQQKNLVNSKKKNMQKVEQFLDIIRDRHTKLKEESVAYNGC